MVFIVMHTDKAVHKSSGSKKPEERILLKPLPFSNKRTALEMAKREVKCNFYYTIMYFKHV